MSSYLEVLTAPASHSLVTSSEVATALGVADNAKLVAAILRVSQSISARLGRSIPRAQYRERFAGYGTLDHRLAAFPIEVDDIEAPTSITLAYRDDAITDFEVESRARGIISLSEGFRWTAQRSTDGDGAPVGGMEARLYEATYWAGWWTSVMEADVEIETPDPNLTHALPGDLELLCIRGVSVLHMSESLKSESVGPARFEYLSSDEWLSSVDAALAPYVRF